MTSNVELKRSGSNELIEAQGEAFKHLQIELSVYSGFPKGGYSPMNLFSDGGAAIFLPNFLGVAQLDNMPVAMQVQLRLIKLEGENLIASDAQAERSYVYFGQGAVQSRAHGDVLIDKAIPEWASETVKQRATLSSNQCGYLSSPFLYSLSPKRIEAFFQCAETNKNWKNNCAV